MSILNSLQESERKSVVVFAPVKGAVLSLAELNDKVFSEGILGDGCGIAPQCTTIAAPFDGNVMQVSESKHALCLESTDGVELLIHVGIDTVELNGQGFDIWVKEGQAVHQGDALMAFDKTLIEAAGYSAVVICVVTNTEEFQNMRLLPGQCVEQNAPLMEMEQGA